MAQSYGWEAEGIDVDTLALDVARGKGLNVRPGTLLEQKYPDSLFDLVTMNHVIEHLHDPIKILQEIYRILKLGGIVLIFTPNLASFGYRRFGVHWLHLDPPRHLILFNPRTLVEAARRANLVHSKIASTLRYSTNIIISERIRDGREANAPLKSMDVLRSRLIALALQLRLWFSPLAGDELVLEARK